MGIIAPLQRLFYGGRVGDQDIAPLSFVAASLNILGGAAIPSMMLVHCQNARCWPSVPTQNKLNLPDPASVESPCCAGVPEDRCRRIASVPGNPEQRSSGPPPRGFCAMGSAAR